MAATMFADRARELGVWFDVVSAGTHVIEGLPMSARTRNALSGVGHSNLDHRSHQLTARDVEGAALIVAMEPGHLKYLEREFPDARSRAGLFPRIAALLEADNGTGTDLAERVTNFGLAEIGPAPEDEVVDPAGGEQPEFDASAAELNLLVDRLLAEVEAGAPSIRTVVSLVPSATDLLLALGLGDGLLAVSHECDHEKAKGLPVATSSNVGAAGVAGGDDPGDIDAAVSAALASGEALYQTDRTLLAELAPEFVVAQEICDVCAVSGPAVRAILPEGTSLITLTATSVDGLYADIDTLAAAFHCSARGEALKSRIARRISGVEAPSTPAKMLTLEWADPPFLGGHWVPELVELAGAANVLSEPGSASRRATWEDIAAAEIDVVVGMQCGYFLDIAVQELSSAIEDGRLIVPVGGVWATDATRLFSRCTSNVAEAVEVLASIAAGTEIPGTAVRVA